MTSMEERMAEQQQQHNVIMAQQLQLHNVIMAQQQQQHNEIMDQKQHIMNMLQQLMQLVSQQIQQQAPQQYHQAHIQPEQDLTQRQITQLSSDEDTGKVAYKAQEKKAADAADAVLTAAKQAAGVESEEKG